jgi:glycosyltransferase involved in cell wall biosynthesis
MRIAVVHNLPPGGAKRAMREICARLPDRGHVLDVFEVPDTEREAFSIRPFARRVFDFLPPTFVDARANLVAKVAGDVRFYSRLRRMYREIARQIDGGGYDLAFVHHCRFTQSPFVLTALEAPSVYYCQEPPRVLYEPPIPRPYSVRVGGAHGALRSRKLAKLKRWDRENALAATVITVNSLYSAESIYRTYGRTPLVARLGVDAERFRTTPKQRERMVVSMGAFNPNKCHDLVIEAVARIPEPDRPRLVITTPSVLRQSPEELYIRALARTRGVELEVTTLVTDESIADLLSRASANVFLPRLEPFGFVPLEAMAAGTPTVGVAEGGVRETIIDGVTGLLCERDADQIARAIERLLADEPLRERLVQAGLEDVRARWRWDSCVDVIERAFDMAVRPQS